MENMELNVLWIDDEHEKLTGTKGRAKKQGIILHPYKSLNGGVDELKRNYPFYDGVLLDAKFFENEEDLSGTEDTNNIHRAKEELLQLPKRFELFVLTGQAEAYEDRTFRQVFPSKIYVKGNDDETERLFADIKEAASKQPDTQLRHQYKTAFDVCTERFIGEDAGLDLLSMLKYDSIENVDDHFNRMRRVLEDLFRGFNKYNLLPAEFVFPTVNLTHSSMFLAGYIPKEPIGLFLIYRPNVATLTPNVAQSLRFLLQLVQDASHRSNVQNHLGNVGNNYLAKSALFLLLDILCWFKYFVNSSPQTENWEVETGSVQDDSDQNWIEGHIINFNQEKGYAFLKPDIGVVNHFVTTYAITTFNLENGSRIRGKIETYTDNRTGEPRTRINEVKVLTAP
jgi:cold shock CspA family protein